MVERALQLEHLRTNMTSPLANLSVSEEEGTRALPQKTKKTRRSAPKSRRGCITCKIRHQKCDETKPACTKCTESSRVCDFLQPPSAGIPVLHVLAPINKLLKLRPNYALTTTTHMPLGEQHLEYFLKVCCVDFSGFFGDRLWDRLIPQLTVAEPSIRYAAVAIGAMHRSHAFEKGITTDSNRHHAMENYTKALSALNSTLARNPECHDLACMASLLFTMFEVCRGNDKGSMIHLRAGLKMMAAMSKDTLRSSSSDCIYELLSIFSRLETQAASFSTYSRTITLTTPIIPSAFFSLVQSRDVLDAIIALMYSYLTPHGRSYKYLPSAPLPRHVACEVEEIRSLLSQWSDKFEGYFQSHPLKHTQRDLAAAEILKISHLSTTTFLDTYFNRCQSSMDAYLPHFEMIVQLAASVIDFAAKTQTHSGRRLAFDIATVQPLQFVARKCRNRTLRRRAIELSDIAGREGVWDGKSIAAVLKWIVAKEEANLLPTEEDVNLGLAKFGEEVPEERDRLHCIRVDFDRLGKQCLIHTTRRLDDKDWDGSWEVLEGSVAWGAQQIAKDERVGLVSAFLR